MNKAGLSEMNFGISSFPRTVWMKESSPLMNQKINFNLIDCRTLFLILGLYWGKNDAEFLPRQ